MTRTASALLFLSILFGCALAPAADGSRVLDRFGVRELYPSLPRGTAWTSNWGNGQARILGYQVDPADPWFDCAHGDAKYSIDGQGILSVSGDTPRMYVHDPEGKRSFANVEITVYGMRIGETKPVGWAGLMAYAKTDHRNDADTCATRGYGARLTYDGRADFEKETAHGKPHGYVQAAGVKPWPRQGGMPTGTWIGYKFILRDMEKGKKVKLEMWLDTTGGKDGGEWELATSYIDEGQWGKEADPCSPGTDPAQVLSGSFPVVYLRTDSVSEMKYKWFSVREIGPLP